MIASKILFWIIIVLVALMVWSFAFAFDYNECRRHHGASYCRSAEAACASGNPGSYNKWCPR
jgi:hypothetical protein